MITITPQAAEQIRTAAKESEMENMSLRLAAKQNSEGAIEYGMGFDTKGPSDIEVVSEEIEVIIFDEAGVGIMARRSMINLNVLVGTVAQSFRYMLGVVIITVPEMSFVDSQVRGLSHFVLRTQSINYKKEYCLFIELLFSCGYNYT